MNEAELVFSYILDCDRLSLYLNKDSFLKKDKSVLVSKALARRISGEPVQYILGKSEFMGLEFKTDRRALIPRPETEILVGSVINELKAGKKTRPEILDIGTGCGCIAVSIAKLLPGSQVQACDISESALKLARENASLNNVNVRFFHSDLFSGTDKKFDLIISNPPYVALKEYYKLERGILFEPQNALKAGTDGLCFYRKITKLAAGYLKRSGMIAFEAGKGQAQEIKRLLQKNGFCGIRIIKDYNNIERVIIGKKQDSSSLIRRDFVKQKHKVLKFALTS